MKWLVSTFAALALLAAMAQAAAPATRNAPAAKTDNRPAPNSPALPSMHREGPVERKIREALAQPTQIEFVETPLKDIVDYLQDLHHIPIQFDAGALKEAGCDESTQVTKNLKGISLRSALRLLLDEKQLKYVVHNEVLLITTEAKAGSAELMETRVYPVADLVRPQRDGSLDLQPLKDVLTATVATNTWRENGGSGNLSGIVVGDRPLLVVRQSQQVQEEIENTLNLLRMAAD